MSTAGEEHHRPHATGHIFMALVALALATIAAYLWLSDGSLSWRSLLPPRAQSPAAAAEIAPVPAAPAPTSTRTLVARTAQEPRVTRSSAEAQVAPIADQPVTVDAQVAADAAAVGMTSRVRSSEPTAPGQ